MNNNQTKRKGRILRWLGWVLLTQVILVNISACLYAYKFTHLYTRSKSGRDEESPRNIFEKSWRLFSGPQLYRSAASGNPQVRYQPVTLHSANGLAIDSWYMPLDSQAKGTVILFHGLAGNKSWMLDQAYEFQEMGYNTLLIDVRSHGKNEGSGTTIGYREAEEVKLAYDYVLQKGEKKIFLWGISMGAVMVLKAVPQYDLAPAGILLELPFRSLHTHIQGRARIQGFPQQPFGILVTSWAGLINGFNPFSFDCADYAKRIHCPVLLQYAGRDQLVKTEEIDAISAALGSNNKELVFYPEARHEPLLKYDPVLWQKKVEGFLEKYR